MGAHFKEAGLIEPADIHTTAASTTTLVFDSESFQRFEGTSNEDCVLPDATTMVEGKYFYISNQSSGTVTVKYDDATFLKTLLSGSAAWFRLVDNSSSNGVWDVFSGSGSGGGSAVVEDLQAYTPTFTGLGTVTTIDAYWGRRGDSIIMVGSATSGTVTGSPASVSLPAGLLADLTKVVNIRAVGLWQRNTAASPAQMNTTVINPPNDGEMYFTTLFSGQSGFSILNGNQLVGSSEFFSWTAEFPIDGWTSNDSNDVSDWVDYPSVAAGDIITGSVSDPTYGTLILNKAMYRQVGDSMDIFWTINQNGTTGTAGSGTYLFHLPPGYMIDLAKTPVGTIVGTWYYDDTGFVGSGMAFVNDATTLTVAAFATNASNNTNAGNWGSGFAGFNTALFWVAFRVTVPISGWTSNNFPPEPSFNTLFTAAYRYDFAVQGGTQGTKVLTPLRNAPATLPGKGIAQYRITTVVLDGTTTAGPVAGLTFTPNGDPGDAIASGSSATFTTSQIVTSDIGGTIFNVTGSPSLIIDTEDLTGGIIDLYIEYLELVEPVP